MWSSYQKLLSWGLTSIYFSSQPQSVPPIKDQPVVDITNGQIHGFYSETWKQDFFLGIPYAQAPIGHLRFSSPKPLVESWITPRNATNYSSACIGYGKDQEGLPISEDCLYLNVVRPHKIDKMRRSLPVAVYIHGGSFIEGSSSNPKYNLSFIVDQSVHIKKPIIAVSINYRLSGWGFLASSDLERGNTNAGLRDQRLALHWVQENIARFGGDPKKVTVWGESAGAGCVGYHLVAYNGRNDNLFRAAIMESGNPIFMGSYNNTRLQSQYDQVAILANCSQEASRLECLRNMPWQNLSDIFNSSLNQDNNVKPYVLWYPQPDKDILYDLPSKNLADGKFVQVPIISGANSDEGTAFCPVPVNDSYTFCQKVMKDNPYFAKLSPSLVREIESKYPDEPAQGIPAAPTFAPDWRPEHCDKFLCLGLQYRRIAAYWGDAMFIAPRRRTCETWANASLPAFCYRFDVLPNVFEFSFSIIRQLVGITHFLEMPFVFMNLEGVGYKYPPFRDCPEGYKKIAVHMANSWISFVADLDPNSWKSTEYDPTNSPSWPIYEKQDPQIMLWTGNETVQNIVLEADTFRKSGIQLINDNVAEYKR